MDGDLKKLQQRIMSDEDDKQRILERNCSNAS